MRVKVVAAPPTDAVERALVTIERRLDAFGAPPSLVERSGDAIVVSWDRGNVADEVVAVTTAPGHFQLRVVTEVRPGACAADTLSAEAPGSVPIAVSSLSVPASCYSLAVAEVSDPVVECVARHRGSWSVVARFPGEAEVALGRFVGAHPKDQVAVVVDAALLEVARGDALVRDGELVATGGLDERAARHYSAVIDGGAHELDLRLERFERLPA